MGNDELEPLLTLLFERRAMGSGRMAGVNESVELFLPSFYYFLPSTLTFCLRPKATVAFVSEAEFIFLEAMD